MIVKVVEINHPDKKHPNSVAKHNHLLIGYSRTFCGRTDFNGLGVEMDISRVDNICTNCQRLCK